MLRGWATDSELRWDFEVRRKAGGFYRPGRSSPALLVVGERRAPGKNVNWKKWVFLSCTENVIYYMKAVRIFEMITADREQFKLSTVTRGHDLLDGFERT